MYCDECGGIYCFETYRIELKICVFFLVIGGCMCVYVYIYIHLGWFSSGGFEVVGNVFDANGKIRYKIDGKWTESLIAYPCNENETEIKDRAIKLWAKNPLPPKSEKQYNFTLVRLFLIQF